MYYKLLNSYFSGAREYETGFFVIRNCYLFETRSVNITEKNICYRTKNIIALLNVIISAVTKL